MAGFYPEVLENGHYVPGLDRFEVPPYAGKPVWRDIMKCTELTALEYAKRVDSDFNRAVSKDASSKLKARIPHAKTLFAWIMVAAFPLRQKSKQLSLPHHQQLMDNTCVWLWLRPQVANAVDSTYMVKLDQMWMEGLLGWMCFQRPPFRELQCLRPHY